MQGVSDQEVCVIGVSVPGWGWACPGVHALYMSDNLANLL